MTTAVQMQMNIFLMDHGDRTIRRKQVAVQPPKKARTSYNYFFQHQRLLLLGSDDSSEAGKEKKKRTRSHGKVSFTHLVKLVSQRWKDLDPETRAIFDEKAKDDMKRYRREFRDYKSSTLKQYMSYSRLLHLKDSRTSGVSGRVNEAIEPEEHFGHCRTITDLELELIDILGDEMITTLSRLR